MKSLILSALALVALALCATESQAQFRTRGGFVAGPRVGFVGGGFVRPVGFGVGFVPRPVVGFGLRPRLGLGLGLGYGLGLGGGLGYGVGLAQPAFAAQAYAPQAAFAQPAYVPQQQFAAPAPVNVYNQQSFAAPHQGYAPQLAAAPCPVGVAGGCRQRAALAGY